MGKDNAQTLFGMDKIPTDNHVRQMLDEVDSTHFGQAYFISMTVCLPNLHLLQKFSCRSDLDSAGWFRIFLLKSINCQNCSKRKHNDGFVEYCPGSYYCNSCQQDSFSLPQEFVVPQDGAAKQN